MPSTFAKPIPVVAVEPIKADLLQYPLRPRAKGVFPKKSSLRPTSSTLGLYSLGAVIPPGVL